MEKMELVLITKIMLEQQSILVLILNHKTRKHFNKQLLILDQSQLLLMLIFVHSNFTRMAFITIECAHQVSNFRFESTNNSFFKQNLIMASLQLDMIIVNHMDITGLLKTHGEKLGVNKVTFIWPKIKIMPVVLLLLLLILLLTNLFLKIKINRKFCFLNLQ